MVISSVTINVIDVNVPPFFRSQPPKIVNVSEHFEGVVFTIFPNDVDLSDELTYNITVEPKHEEDEDCPFVYNVFTGKYKSRENVL